MTSDSMPIISEDQICSTPHTKCCLSFSAGPHLNTSTRLFLLPDEGQCHAAAAAAVPLSPIVLNQGPLINIQPMSTKCIPPSTHANANTN